MIDRPTRAIRHATALALTILFAVGPAAAALPWYDPEPLMVWLRPVERPAARKAVGDLGALTLYDLDVDLDLAKSRFSVHEVVYFTNREKQPLSEVVLRIYADSGTAQPKVTLRRGSCAETRCTVHAPSTSVIRVRPRTPLPAGARLRITLELEGRLDKLPAASSGLLGQSLSALAGLSSAENHERHSLLAQSEGIGLLSSFYAVVARRTRNGWVASETKVIGDVASDELGHVRARIRSPAAVRIESNGATLSDTVTLHARGRGRHLREKRVVAACVRDFVIVAGENLVSASRSVGDVVVSSHFLAQDRSAGVHVLEVAAESLAAFERRFGSYPYTHFAVAQAPLAGGAGGVEFSGFAVVGSTLYRPLFSADAGLGELGKQFAGVFGNSGGLSSFLKPKRHASGPRSRSRSSSGAVPGAKSGASSTGLSDLTRSMREFVTAHEVAHQWWHGLIGNDSQAHPFVDESLAQYSTVVYLEDRYGKARAEREATLNLKLGYLMMRAAGQPDGAVARSTADFPSPLAYAGLVYGKGPYFFQELRRTLGDRAFFDRLRAYAEAHRFRTAGPDALLDALGNGRQRQAVSRLAERWLEQAHGDEDLGSGGLGALMGALLGKNGSR